MAELNENRIGSYFLAEWRPLLIVTLTGIIYNIGLAVVPVLEGKMLQGLVDFAGSRDALPRMLEIAAAYLLTVLCVQGTRALKRLYVRRFSNNVGLRIKGHLYRSLLHINPSDSAGESTGSIMTKAISDADACAEGMRKVTTEIFDTGVALVSYSVTLFLYDPLLAASVIIFPPLAVLCAELFRKKVTSSVAESRESAGKLSNATLDRVGNGIIYRVNGLEKVRDGIYGAALRDYERKTVISGVWTNGLTPVYRFISYAGVILIVFAGGKNVAGTGHVQWDIAAFTAFLSCFTKLAVKAAKTSKLFNSIQKAKVSWKRIKPLLCPLPADPEPLPAEPQRLEVCNLSVRYGENTVFSGLSFTACPGEIIGVTGQIACGKSALGKAFLCEKEPEGSITFGNSPLFELISSKNMHYVSYMGHNPELFDGTIEDNIRMGREGSLEEILAACRIDGEIAGFPDGIHTVIGSRGMRLSGGQAARVALARTLFHPAPIIVLDDPFSAVDMKTEKEIFAELRKRVSGIIILISHRLSVFPDTDRVLLMENGSVTVSTHSVLLANSETYAKLVAMQSAEGGDEG